jgi:hypothetical protein
VPRGKVMPVNPQPVIQADATKGQKEYSNIYYYCSADVFFSILINGTLWLTDNRLMNDIQECQFIGTLFNKFKNQFDDDENKKIDDFMENEMSSPKFLCCFSDDGGDKLSQWRGYGNDGQGFSIGFDRMTLNQMIGVGKELKTVSYYDDVEISEYDPNNPNSLIRQSSIVEKIKTALKDGGYLRQLAFLSALVKHNSFIEEKEVRIICCDDDGKKFECVKNRIFPYIEVDVGKSIKEIILGPCNKSTSEDIKCFLKNHSKLENKDSVSVHTSGARKHYGNR